MFAIFRSNFILRILLISINLTRLAAGMLAPIYAIFVEEIGGTVIDAGMTMAVFAIAASITSMITGYYADHMKKRVNLVIVGYAITAVVFFLLPWVTSIGFLLIFQVILGMAEAMYWPAFDSLYTQYLDKKHESLEWSQFESSNYLTIAVGAYLGSYIVQLHGFPTLFFTMAGLTALSTIILYVHSLKKRI